jgi:abortive infection bacteriophage resistance protein
MNKISFTKPPLTYSQQIDLLRKRGLIIASPQKAYHLLEKISYYRLSGYWYPLLEDKENHIFKTGATIENAFKLYCFDRELRKLVLSEIEKIEVAIRGKMIYDLSHSYGPFWFQNINLFKSAANHTKTLNGIFTEFERSDEEFIKAFKEKYSDPLPPSWMMMEITSFGTLSMLYQNLKPAKERRSISNYFGLADGVFQTWLHSFVYLRNVCAHHSRLWNRAMSIQPQIPHTPRKQWLLNTTIKNNRTYYILSMILFLLQTVNPKQRFNAKFKGMLRNYPNIDVKAMGFPEDWENEPLWIC